MNDEHANGAAACGFFVFVGPAAVVSEGLALEEGGVVRGRLVDDDQGDLAVQVDVLAVGAGEVVPVIFGGMNAVTDEDDGRVEVRSRLAGFVFGDDLGGVGELDGLAGSGLECEFGLVFDGVDGDQWNALEVGAVVARRLNPGQGKLCGDVLGGKLCAAGAGATAFEQIQREEADVSADFFGIDGGCGGAGSGWNTGDFRN